ncbi:DoxX family protein [Marinobacterium lutimaris]|uniref:Putative oxidoreductase n=1 Tax=Marinobacterium lutimaris TaxID=568106 RepID=A0A1H5VLX7_9GAMM|nr:DoxX family protein [Marinobacterium lutimaris]SEF87547.1 putative oxidoreductase [Marinobacterium lutimaris]
MKSLVNRVAGYYGWVSRLLSLLQPVALLAARLYVAKVFFAAGLTKLQDWDTTLFLFEEEYSVPLLPFELAAWLATAGEILLPLLLVFGLATRVGALGLSVVNIVAVISLEEIAPAALTQHLLWGVLLAQILIWGAGALSLDRLVKTRPKVSEQMRSWTFC